MPRKMPPPPKWANPCLQGLAHWMGYQQQCITPSVRLPEAAIVTALGQLMFAHRTEGQSIHTEALYRDCLKAGGFGRTRIDLALFEREQLTHMVEVKRSANLAYLVEDVTRLGTALEVAREAVRGFLIVASQAKIPNGLVTSDGTAMREVLRLNQRTPYHTKVRRVCKASHSFRKKAPKAAHYACLLEVFCK
jgi:hypothetical protein